MYHVRRAWYERVMCIIFNEGVVSRKREKEMRDMVNERKWGESLLDIIAGFHPLLP